MLWQHQKQMLDFATERQLIYAGMSTGKTLFGLHWLKRFSGLRLVLAPKAALSVWAEDRADFLPDSDEVILLNRGTSKDKAKQVAALTGNAIVVVNYETARLLPLKSYGFTAVIADEAHKMSSYNSKQSLTLAKSCAQIPFKVAMTGTPFADGYDKLYGIVRWLFPKLVARGFTQCRIFGKWQDFLSRYFHTFEVARNVVVPSGVKDLAALSASIKPFTLQLLSEDVVRLPAVVERVYRPQLRGPAARAYRQLDKDGMVHLDGVTSVPEHLLTRLIRLQQLATNGQVLTDEGETLLLEGVGERLELLKELLAQISEPVVVFTRYQYDVKLIKALLSEPIAELTGSRDNHEDWKQGKYRVLVANIAAGAESVRLQRARHAIFWSVGYSNSQFQQARMRIRRVNQVAATVFFHYIVSKGTVDEEIYKVLSSKERGVEKMNERLKR